MSTELRLITEGNRLLMAVPRPFYSAFREFFKVAPLGNNTNTFEVAASTKNRLKWLAFMDSVKVAAERLATAGPAEAATQEQEQDADASDRAVERALDALQDCAARTKAAQARKLRAEEQLQELTPILAKSTADLAVLLEETAAAERARDAAIAPALTLYERHYLKEILVDISRAADRGYAGQEALGRAQGKLIALRDDMRLVGYRLEAIDFLAGVALNRTDKLREFAAAAVDTMRSGLETFIVTADCSYTSAGHAH